VAIEATFKAMDLDEYACDDEMVPSNKIPTADCETFVLFGSHSDRSRDDVSRCDMTNQNFITDMYCKCAESAMQKRL